MKAANASPPMPAQAPHLQSEVLQRYYPALDGLRAIAFIVVFCFHFCRPVSTLQLWKWGWVGVDLFFAISGFLITGILFDSLNKENYLRHFYLRRTLRIFPLYYGFWLLVLLLTPVLHVQWNRYLVAMVFYLGNLYIPGGLAGLHADPGIILLAGVGPRLQHFMPTGILVNHFWSLCVEEQFYLVWPLALLLLRSRRNILLVCFALLAIVPFGRLLYLHTYPSMLDAGGLYFSTWSRPDGLLMGAALAIFLRNSSISMARLRTAGLAIAAAATLLLILLVHFEAHRSAEPLFDPAVSGFGFSLIALASTGVLALALEHASGFTKFLQYRPLVAIGRVTYGMYFYHEILYSFIMPKSPWFIRHHVGFVVPFISFGVTYFVSVLSFRFFESKFLRLKERWSSRPGEIDDPPSTMGASPIRLEAS